MAPGEKEKVVKGRVYSVPEMVFLMGVFILSGPSLIMYVFVRFYELL